jgi:hypothetical protein
MADLTQDQFNMIKTFVEHNTGLIMNPQLRDDDTGEVRESQQKNQSDINALQEEGFLEEVSENFAEMMEELEKEGLRKFRAYKVSDIAWSMFGKEVPNVSMN